MQIKIIEQPLVNKIKTPHKNFHLIRLNYSQKFLKNQIKNLKSLLNKN